MPRSEIIETESTRFLRHQYDLYGLQTSRKRLSGYTSSAKYAHILVPDLGFIIFCSLKKYDKWTGAWEDGRVWGP